MKYFITLIILFVYSNFSFLLAQNDKDNTLMSHAELSDAMTEISSVLEDYLSSENEIADNLIEGNLKNFYGKQNKYIQDSIVGRLCQEVELHIANDDIDATKKVSHLLHSIAPYNDKRLCSILFDEANLAESKMDSVYLSQIINNLTVYSNLNKVNIQDKLKLLNEKLQSICNSQNHFIGTWVSDKQLTIKNPYPDYIIDITQDSIQKFHICTRFNYYIEKKLFKKSSFSQMYENFESNFVMDVSENELYSNWFSERLKIGNADLSTFLRGETRDLNASIVGHYARKNEYSFEEKIGVDLLTGIGSMLINNLLDNIAVSQKKIYIYEQSMNLIQPNIMFMGIQGQRLKIKSSNLNYIDKYEYNEEVKLLRLDDKKDMPITYSQLSMSKKEIKKLGIQDEEFNNIYRLSRRMINWSSVIACITGAGIGLGLGSFAFKPSDDGMGFKGYKTMAYVSLGVAAAGLITSFIVFPKMIKKINKKILNYNEKKMQKIRNNTKIRIAPSSENLGISLLF